MRWFQAVRYWNAVLSSGLTLGLLVPPPQSTPPDMTARTHEIETWCERYTFKRVHGANVWPWRLGRKVSIHVPLLNLPVLYLIVWCRITLESKSFARCTLCPYRFSLTFLLPLIHRHSFVVVRLQCSLSSCPLLTRGRWMCFIHVRGDRGSNVFLCGLKITCSSSRLRFILNLGMC